MARSARHREQGVALIQALMLAAILGLLILSVGQTARQQVSVARALVERTEAELQAQSGTASLTYALLTEPWIVANTGPKPPVGADVTEGAVSPFAAAWNFQGQSFALPGEMPGSGPGTIAAVRDENGRLAVPLYSATEFVALLRELGVDAARAERLGEQVLWLQAQGSAEGTSSNQAAAARLPAERRYPVQRLDELRTLPDMDDALYAKLQPLMTTYPTPGLNLLTAEPELLATRLTPVQRSAVLELQSRGQLDAGMLWRTAGVEADESTVLTPGPAFTIRVDAGTQTLRVRHTELVVIQPYRDEAVLVWSRTASEPPPATRGPG
jgi:general secretion pathway protein K